MNNEQIVEKIVELENRIQKIEQSLGSGNVDGGLSAKRKDNITVGEFLIEKKPTSDREKALLFAAFYEQSIGDESFNTDDILNIWRKAKEKKPSNINNLIDQNIKKGLIAENSDKKDGKKSWFVTRSGIDLVEGGFKKEI